MAQKNSMAASLQVKKGRLYAVIQHKGPDGKYKSVWRALGLPEDANKAKVSSDGNVKAGVALDIP